MYFCNQKGQKVYKGEHEPGMPFDFTYAVKDDVGNDFSHNAESNGDVVKGEYRTLLPDGRLQIVKYTADWKNGYNAEITYEGEAAYPDPPKTSSRPPAPPPPPRTTKNPYLSDTDIDSQGLTPSRPRPQTQPPRPQTQPPRPATRPPPRPQQTQPPRPQTRPPPPQTRPPPPQTRPPPPPRPQTTPAPPPGLYGAPSVPFGVRNNPKFGYSRK
ncbi:unnamed protein product [Orchesella dallaii]|uniref:Pro-resilin n=1 Tax=Orchesella dallaii TaxID=48710 RepID=A0ABP1QYY8_9HEXA